MEKHDLLHEFPEFKEKIHQLKIDNHHFRAIFDEYDALAHQIYRIKTDIEIVTDEHLKELKARLLHLKDEIFEIIKN